MGGACSRVALGDLGRPAGSRSLTPNTLGSLLSSIKAQLVSTSGSRARWARGAGPSGVLCPRPCPQAAARRSRERGALSSPVARRAAGEALCEVWAPGLEEEARARAGRRRSRSGSGSRNKNRSRGQSTKSPGRLQAPRTPMNGEGGGSRGAMRAVAVEENLGVGAPRCFRSCLGWKRKILELVAPSGLPVANTRGQRCPCYKPGLRVWWCGQGSHIQSPLLGAAQEEKGPGGARKGKSHTLFLWPALVGERGNTVVGSSRQTLWK